ncbi:unnamed protein product [Strongylus vulgaris]|uniref:Aquaporin n=1 Tax=Strongylus vulgaris TaxID=40348 RepID=A0A3P7L7Z3_STRVU|nr:unnamed protein product [Strongylus vulgaris]
MANPLLPEERLRQKIQIRDKTLRNALGEFFGTALLLFIGIGIVMQFVLSHEKLNTWVQINIGWGFAIAFCVYTICKLSGGHLNPAVSFAFYTLGKLPLKDYLWGIRGHLNPAVSFAFYTLGKLPLKDCLFYCFAQTFGAFVGTAGAYGIYFVAGPKGTGVCFCSFPEAHVSNTIAFFDQVRSTSMGMNVGYPINPARDLGPRIFMLFIGYGSEAFT